MQTILLINGKKEFAHSQGLLNQTLHNFACSTLTTLGYSIRQTTLEDGYDIEEEVQKYLWADVVIYQMPAWWMGAPWTMKKYLDEVLTEGHGRLYQNDGRSRSDPTKKYGSGGLLHGKKYLLSLTWNAPKVAFDEPDQFFEGKGIDAVYFPFHKANEFLDMAALPTFLCNDVIKNPNIDDYLARYESHLLDIFSNKTD